MKIKITTSCSGLTFSFYEGQTVDVDKKIGEDLVQCGFAEEVRDTKITRRDTKSKTCLLYTSSITTTADTIC